EDDVHLGMSENPEQVLPQQRIAASRDVEEGNAEASFHFQQDAAEDERWKTEDDHERHGQHVPREDGHAVERHSRSAHLQDSDDEFYGAGNARNLNERNAQQPEILALVRRELERRQGGVHEPAAVWYRPDDEAR